MKRDFPFNVFLGLGMSTAFMPAGHSYYIIIT